MKKGHRPEQIVKMFREADAKIAAGSTVDQVCRELGISDATYYIWRKNHGKMKLKQLKKLQKENAILKKLVSDLSSDKAVQHVQKNLKLSERRACRTLSQSRVTQRYQPRRPDKDKPSVQEIKRLAEKHHRYGYRRMAGLPLADGWWVNRRRVYRLRCQDDLKVSNKQRKRPKAGSLEKSCTCRWAECATRVWSRDFVVTRPKRADDSRCCRSWMNSPETAYRLMWNVGSSPRVSS